MNAYENIAIICLALSWSIAGLAFAWAQYKESKSWVDDDGGGDDPANPYSIDPVFDPSDWWKHEPKVKR